MVMKPPKILDAIADRVLAHKPKPKSKPARKRARRAKEVDAFSAGAEAMRDLVIDYLGGNGSLEQIARVRAMPLPDSAGR